MEGQVSTRTKVLHALMVVVLIKPGTGEILAFGINRTYDATDDAKNDETTPALSSNKHPVILSQ